LFFNPLQVTRHDFFASFLASSQPVFFLDSLVTRLPPSVLRHQSSAVGHAISELPPPNFSSVNPPGIALSELQGGVGGVGFAPRRHPAQRSKATAPRGDTEAEPVLEYPECDWANRNKNIF